MRLAWLSMADTPQFVTSTDLSLRLGLSESWLKTEARAGRLPHLKTGRRFMFHVQTVERALLERSEQRETQPA